MKLPKIDTDDLVLFGSLLIFAVGAGLVVISRTGDGVLAFGAACIVFGLPSAVIAFLAAAETTE